MSSWEGELRAQIRLEEARKRVKEHLEGAESKLREKKNSTKFEAEERKLREDKGSDMRQR